MSQGQPELLGGPLEHGRRVIGIEDRIIARQADLPGMPPQQPGGEAVEGAHLHGLRTHQVGDPAAHLVGSLVGEGKGHDRSSWHARSNEVRHPVGDHPGLPATRTC